jgi:hypothetical protein
MFISSTNSRQVPTSSSLLNNEHRGSLPAKSGQNAKLTAHLHIFCVFVESLAVPVCGLTARLHPRVKFLAIFPSLGDFICKNAYHAYCHAAFIG